MINALVEEGLNTQINNELESAYTYLAMSAHLETTIYTGFAKWMRLQAEEERGHAMKLFDYLNDRGGKVVLASLEQPKSDYNSTLEIFEAALLQERNTTGQINGLYETANSEKDYATLEFLGWFLSEQVEEENAAEKMVDRMKLAGDQINALLRLDYEAAKRES